MKLVFTQSIEGFDKTCYFEPVETDLNFREELRENFGLKLKNPNFLCPLWIENHN